MTKRDAAAVAVIVAVVTLIFSDVLFFGRAFYFRDVTRFYYPMKKVTRDIILSGDFPSWNPYLSQGQPLAANPEFAVWYPPHWLLLLPDFELAFRLHVVLHYFIAAIGMYALLRSWRLRIAGATFGAFAYTFGGLLLSLACLLPYLFCLAWLPWLLFFLGRPRARDAAFASICLALILLGGEPVTIAECILIAAVYVVWRRAFARGAFVLAAALLIASVQIVPGADHLRDSVRSRPFTFHLVSTWSTPPLRAAELLVPEAFGFTGNHAAFYWGTGMYNGLDPFFLSIYPGLLTAALAFAAIFARRRGWIFVVAALVAGFVIALGSHTPLLKLLYDARLFSSFRYPEKFLILAVVPLTAFAAFAFEQLVDGDERIRRIAMAISAVVAIVCAALAAAALMPSYPDAFARFWGIAIHPFRNTMAAISLTTWTLGFARAAVVLGLLFLHRRMRADRWAIAAIAVLVLDLGFERPYVAETIEREFFSQRPSTIPAIPKSVRLFHQADWYGVSGIARAYFDRPEMYWAIRNGAYPHVGAEWGIAGALNRDIDRTALLPTGDLLEAMNALRTKTPHWFEPLMAMSNAGFRAMYLPLTRAGSGKTIRPIIFVPAATNPRFYFADQVAPSNEFVERIAAGKWTQRIAFIDGVGPPTSAAGTDRVGPPTSAAGPTPPVSPGSVLSLSERSNSAQLRVRASGEALLVISITRHKYWHASIDGRPAVLLPVNIAYQALQVPAGTHEIRLWYDNPLVRWFGIVSLLSLVGVIAIGYVRA